jgi:hypothetical protein
MASLFAPSRTEPHFFLDPVIRDAILFPTQDLSA